MPTYKIAVVGDGAVGKSSLLEAKQHRIFDREKAITIGVDFKLIPLSSTEATEQPSTFLAMDLGGQKRFHFMHSAYIKGIKAALVLFDVSRMRTFFNIEKWYQLILAENDKIPVLFVGNKLDLIDEEEQQRIAQELDELIDSIPHNQNIFGPYFISSKDFFGIDDIFAICEEMVLLEIYENTERIKKKQQVAPE